MKDEILHGDCLEMLKQIPDDSIDMVLCDLPYGTTANRWDTVIPLDKLWKEYERLLAPKGNIVLFGQGLFSVKLINCAWKTLLLKLLSKVIMLNVLFLKKKLVLKI